MTGSRQRFFHLEMKVILIYSKSTNQQCLMNILNKIRRARENFNEGKLVSLLNLIYLDQFKARCLNEKCSIFES